MLRMLSNRRSRVLGISLVVTASVATPTRGQAPASRSPLPVAERLAEMQHHFLQVSLIHEAVIRGDLAAVRNPAGRLAGIPVPRETPARTVPFVQAIREAGRRAATAPGLADVAAETVVMLRQCRDCHLASSVYPTPSTPRRPDVGGVVGHMLEHQRAADELLQGLLIPSNSHWRRGAERLSVAELHPGEWPFDRALSTSIRKAETRVHELAARASKAASVGEREDAYMAVLTACASCHGMHPRAWGPGR